MNEETTTKFNHIPKALFALSGLNLVPPLLAYFAVPKNSEYSTLAYIILGLCFIIATFVQLFMFYITFKRDGYRDLLDRNERMVVRCEGEKTVLHDELRARDLLAHDWRGRATIGLNNLFWDDQLFAELKTKLSESDFMSHAKIDERRRLIASAMEEINKPSVVRKADMKTTVEILNERP